MARQKDDDDQQALDGTEVEGLTSVHVSFGALDIKVEKEPKHRDQVYLVIGGKIKTIGDASGGVSGLNVTVVGAGQFITKADYEKLVGIS